MVSTGTEGAIDPLMHHITEESGAHRLDPRLAAPYRPRVVLAEDDPAMRRLLGDALLADGYEVIELANGDALFEFLDACAGRREAPALIVSDVRMPGRSGIQVLRAIRTWGWSVPVILITAFGDEHTRRSVKLAGGACLFSKPLDIDDLRMAAMNLLPRRRLPPIPERAD